MGRGGRALRSLFGVTLLVGVIWFFFVGIIANHATAMTKSMMVPSTRDFKHWEFVAQERYNFHQDFHLNYVSKRRVPNGPDPIHNRYIFLSQTTCMCIFSSSLNHLPAPHFSFLFFFEFFLEKKFNTYLMTRHDESSFCSLD